MMANNGVDFFEDTNEHIGVWCGFMPHTTGCIVSAVTIVNASGIEAAAPSWVGTTLNLESYISAGLVDNAAGYITEITLSAGAAQMLKDNVRNM